MSIPEVIFWDFDGVILNSMPIRDKGFLHIFKEYPAEKVAQLLDFHHQNGGLSRYVKIRYFYEKILQEPISEEKVMELAQEFSHIMRQELANTELLIEDSLNFIKKYHSEKKFHIVSGSDEKELQFLCKELGIADYFVSIHGSPTPKKELVSRLIQAHGYSVENCVLIGDSINDYEAAVQNGINFWGYHNEKLRNLGLYIDKLSKQ
jgi:HAD superfamily hydrolase (TIGR01549 family)